jgi:hypothetical protein
MFVHWVWCVQSTGSRVEMEVVAIVEGCALSAKTGSASGVRDFTTRRRGCRRTSHAILGGLYNAGL